MMMVEPDGVLFAGDIVQNGRIPFMNSDDVNTSQWLKALDEVLALNPKFIIPGHGKPSAAAREAIAFTRDYIAYVRSAMSNAVENWRDFDTAYDQADWTKYRQFPAFSNNNRGNAYRIYLELEVITIQKIEITFDIVGSQILEDDPVLPFERHGRHKRAGRRLCCAFRWSVERGTIAPRAPRPGGRSTTDPVRRKEGATPVWRQGSVQEP